MRISDWSSDLCSSDLLRCQGYWRIADPRWGCAWAREGLPAHRRSDCTSRGQCSEYAGAVSDRNLGTPGASHPTSTCRGQIGRASCRERVCQYVYISVDAVSL